MMNQAIISARPIRVGSRARSAYPAPGAGSGRHQQANQRGHRHQDRGQQGNQREDEENVHGVESEGRRLGPRSGSRGGRQKAAAAIRRSHVPTRDPRRPGSGRSSMCPRGPLLVRADRRPARLRPRSRPDPAAFGFNQRQRLPRRQAMRSSNASTVVRAPLAAQPPQQARRPIHVASASPFLPPAPPPCPDSPHPALRPAA